MNQFYKNHIKIINKQKEIIQKLFLLSLFLFILTLYQWRTKHNAGIYFYFGLKSKFFIPHSLKTIWILKWSLIRHWLYQALTKTIDQIINCASVYLDYLILSRDPLVKWWLQSAVCFSLGALKMLPYTKAHFF